MRMAHFEGGVAPHEHEEGELTKTVESFTSQIPSGFYLGLGMACIPVSLALHLSGRKEDAQFIGHWVPTILLLGLYNKLVKVAGSD